MSRWLGEDTDFPHNNEYTVCIRDGIFDEWKVIAYFDKYDDAIEFKSIIRFPKQNRGMVSFLKGYSKTGPIITGTPAGANRFTMQDWKIATL